MTKKNAGHGIVVVGGQWGDEGKGRIVDSLSADCALTVRFHGGNNAGHSLHFDGKSLVLHLIPCGIVRATNIAVIGNGVVIDPEVLLKEMNDFGILIESSIFRLFQDFLEENKSLFELFMKNILLIERNLSIIFQKRRRD